MNNLPAFLAIVPFVIFLFTLFVLKKSLLFSSVITLFIYTILALFYWQIFPFSLYVSYGKGIFVALDIFVIIFGAIFFIDLLKDLKIIQNISYYLESFSKDYRIQVILIAWFFSSFLEGTAGFGIPAAIAVPILIGIGLSPIKSLIIGLLGNSTAGVFGAVGTPIRVGFAGLNVAGVPVLAAMLSCVGFVIPVFMLWVMTSGRINRKKEFLGALPFAIWSGILLVIPSLLISFWGQEFPSIIGPLIGLVLIIISTRFNIFTPKEKISLSQEKEIVHTMSFFKSFSPYLILIIFLILGKVFIGSVSIPLSVGFNHNFNVFNPGFVFILTGIIISLIWKIKKSVFSESAKSALKGAIAPFLVITSMSVIVQIMINSGNNFSGISSAINLISKGFETAFLPFFAPFVGAFGSFITGSVTISNIMFGSIISTAGVNVGLSVASVLALSIVGAAIGNMTALADILTAEATIKEKNREREILKGVFIPCLICLVIVGVIGLLIF